MISGNNLLTSCHSSTLDLQTNLNTAARCDHLITSGHVMLLNTSKWQPISLGVKARRQVMNCFMSYYRERFAKCFVDTYHMISSFSTWVRHLFIFYPKSNYKSMTYSKFLMKTFNFYLILVGVTVIAIKGKFETSMVQHCATYFLFWPCHAPCGILAPQPGIEHGTQQWKPRILTTRPPGNS